MEIKKKIIPLRIDEKYKPNEPNGWLGLLCAGKLYFDFTDAKEFDSRMKELIDELRIKLNRGLKHYFLTKSSIHYCFVVCR